MAASIDPLRLVRRFIAPLLLLMITVHALMPLGQPAQRIAGSAFSAETADVSLRSGQRATVAKAAGALKLPVPSLPRGSMLAPVVSIAAPTGAATRFRFSARAPPADARTSFSPLSPRAPPAA
jgi:hypothetical protein